MENKYFYKQLPTTAQRQFQEETNQLLSDIYTDLFLKSVHHEQTIARIEGLIDRALDERDVEAFQHYTQLLGTIEEK